MLRLLLCPLGIFLMSALSTFAREFVFESKPTRTHLLELFTSEGCSSCPPAEAAFSRLKQNPALWRDFVPVAFHVDYWDNVGWRVGFESLDAATKDLRRGMEFGHRLHPGICAGWA